MLGEKKLKQLAGQVLKYSTANETEVLLMVNNNGLTRFANTQIHQHVAWNDLGISVRCVIGKKIGVASTNSFEKQDLQGVVDKAIALAKLQREDPFYVSLPEPKNIPSVESEVFETTEEERAAAVNIILQKSKSKNITASGAYASSMTEIAVANSHGVWAYHISSGCDLSTILLGETSTGFGAQVGRKNNDINAEEVANTAISKVELGANPVEVEPGEWEVVLEPQSVNEMMTFLSFYGPNSRIYHEQASYFSGKIGTKVMNDNITLIDDPLNKEAFPMPFDFEGSPKKKLEIIKNGVLKHIVYDSYDANRYNVENTGHALPAPNTFGAVPLHMTFEPGKDNHVKIIKNIKKGLLVTRLWYVRVLNPKTLSITGMTRDGLFLIKDGEFAGGVKNLRFNQSIPLALNNVRAVSNDLVPLSSFELELGINRMPYLHIGNWNFTSGTTF